MQTKENISMYCLLKILRRVVSVKEEYLVIILGYYPPVIQCLTLMSTIHNIFVSLWRNKKNIHSFWLKNNVDRVASSEVYQLPLSH